MVCFAEAMHGLGEAERAEALLDSIEEQAGSAPALLGLGRIALLSGDFAGADSLGRAALALYEARAEPAGVLVAKEGIALALQRMGRWEEAAALLEEVLLLAEKTGSAMAKAHARYRLGSSLKELARGAGPERTAEAARVLRLAIDEAEGVDVPLWAAEARLLLSIIARWRGDLDRCLDLRREALRGFEAAGHTAAQADCMQRIAAIHLMREEYGEAERILHEARLLASEAGSPRLRGWIVLNLGSIAHMTGAPDRAIAYYDEAADAARLDGDDNLLAATLVNSSLILGEEGRHDEALGRLQEALEACRRSGDRRSEARVAGNIGHRLLEAGRFEEAVAQIESTIALGREIGSIGTTEAYLHRDLGLALSELERWEESEKELLEADRAAKAMALPVILEDVLRGRARIARARGNRPAALAFLDEAIAIREGVRGRLAHSPRTQSGRFGRAESLYEETVDLLFEMHAADRAAGFDRRAFRVAERAKARSFIDLLVEAEVKLRSRADTAYARRESEIERRVADLAGTIRASGWNRSTELEIARLEEEREILEGEVRQSDPRYGAVAYPMPISVDQLRAEVLRGEELLIEYLLGEEASFAWTVSKDAFRFYRLPPRATIEREARSLIRLLSDYNRTGADPAYYVDAAKDLYESILAPAAEEVARAGTIVIAPHGILDYLPFEALPAGEIERADRYGSIPYLLTNHDVSYAPSGSALALLRHAPRPDRVPVRDLLLIGDPARGEGLSPFAAATLGDDPPPPPFAREEMAVLTSLFPAERLVVLRGEEATLAAIEEAARSQRFRSVHFATHGVFHERRPRYSGLLIAADPASGEDGYLTIDEVFRLRLACGQVVLSACSSALGEEISGEGIVGLTRAFLYAGASNVVASLWEVSGEETTSLMKRFYRAAGDVRGRRAALAEAKRAMIGAPAGDRVDTAHPYFWASFVLTGSGL